MPLPIAILIFWHVAMASWGWPVLTSTRGRQARKDP